MHYIRFVAVFLLAGCASAEKNLAPAAGLTTTQVQTSTGIHSLALVRDPAAGTYAVPARDAEVWSALPVVFALLEIPAGTIRGTPRSFGHPSLRLNRQLAGERPSRYLDCGRTPIGASVADTYLLEIGIVAAVQPSGQDASTVQIAVQATATPAGGSTRITCTSTGRLEARVVEELTALLGSRS